VLADVVAFLLTALLAAGFVALAALVAVASAAGWWSLRGALRRRGADRRLEALRERHYADVAERARRRPPAQADVPGHGRTRVELDAVEFGDWPVLGDEPPVVFPRRRAA
jgi:hypothetical protein